jgi:hypothetical protein
MQGGAVGHNIERGPLKDHLAMSSLTYIPVVFCEIFLSADLYRFCKFGIFWWKITFKSSRLKPLNQMKRNLTGMVSFQYCVRQPLQLKFLSKRFRCDFYLIIFLNRINCLRTSHRKTQNICFLQLSIAALV